jgi:ligand-binding SRPBCC domain-containing protein
MRHYFQAEQWLPYPVDTVFNFFANPENLPRLMPAWQKARIDSVAIVIPPPRHRDRLLGVRSETTQAAGIGTRMKISFRAMPFLPIRFPWDAEITDFSWDDHFCDIQLPRGPFAYWRHCHRLTGISRAGSYGTLVRDQLEYELPLGFLGDLANVIFVRRQVQAIFAYRHGRTAELVTGNSDPLP